MGLLTERRDLLIGLAVAVALVVVLAVTGEDDSLVIGVTSGAAYGLVALGLVLVYKSSGVFNFAQGEFGTVALYALYLLDFEAGYWLAVAGALVAAGADGVPHRADRHPAAVRRAPGDPARRHGRRRPARHRHRDLVRHRPGQADRQGLRPCRPRHDPRRAGLRPAAAADRRARRAGRPARPVLHPHQPRPGHHRRQPGADGDRARRHQRAPAVDVHVGAGRAARRRSPRCSPSPTSAASVRAS